MAPIRDTDLRKLGQDIEKAVAKKLPDVIASKKLPIECPHCHAEILFSTLDSVCPMCGRKIDLTVNLH